MNIRGLIDSIRATPDCIVLPPAGLPRLDAEHALPADLRDFFRHDLDVDPTAHVLPDDLREFYELCGGATLFQHAYYGFSIIPPAGVMIANPIIIPVKEKDKTMWLTSKGDVSWSWYLIATDGSIDITIDLDRDRLGCCYDSFWEVHPGNSETIALSFTELLARLFAAQGKELYWT